MKQNFDTSALRQTAAEIQGAVKPKSITPAMVGGLFSALVEAQGEVIEALAALEREVVTVKVNGYDGAQRVSAAGAKVYVDIFSIGGVPTGALPRQELTADANGVVTFEVFKGYRYAVFSKIEGLGASFQFSFSACQNTRRIELWNCPIGIFALGYVAYFHERYGTCRRVPIVMNDFDFELLEGAQFEWWDAKKDEVFDDGSYIGVLVSTAETAFIIKNYSTSQQRLAWLKGGCPGQMVPTLPAFYLLADEDPYAAWDLAIEDFDGSLNTGKIQAFCKNAQAADFCVKDNNSEESCFLPSAGQLFLIRTNRTTINNLIDSANANGIDLVPIGANSYWSSSQCDEYSAYVVFTSGNNATYNNAEFNAELDVLAVSTFVY